MAPLLISYRQSIIDGIHKQQLVEEYIKQHGQPSASATESPAIHAKDEAEVSVESEVTNSSSDISLDQSNNGFSLVNLHWASFSTGLSSVLAVVLVGLFIAGCCYFRGRRQRQTRSCHTELLHAPPFVPNLALTQGPLPALHLPSTQQSLSIIPSPASPHSLLPYLVASQVLPPLTSDPLQSSSTLPVPPATCLLPMRRSRPSPSTAGHPPQSTTATSRVSARPESVPSTDNGSVPTTFAAPSTASPASSGRIVPAHSHKDYNRRDFSRSAVPGSVFNLKVTY